MPLRFEEVPRHDAGAEVMRSGMVARAAVPGRPKQGPTLSEGRSLYSASGVSS